MWCSWWSSFNCCWLKCCVSDEARVWQSSLCVYLVWFLLGLSLVFLCSALIGGYRITDCGLKWGKCPVGRGLPSDFSVVMTEQGFSSVSCACGFSLNSLNDDFLLVDCLVASLYEQLGGSDTGVALGLVLDF